MMAVMEGLHDDDTACASRVGDRACLFGVGGKGFLAEHWFACGDRRESPAAVQSVRKRDVDGVDVGVLDEARVVGKHPWNATLDDPSAGPIDVPCSNSFDDGSRVGASRA
jgi:hypothetical protein